MPLPRQPGVYRDCYEIWEAAHTTRGGTRTFVGADFAKAQYLRSRMHQARSLLRDQNRRAFPKEHPLYDTSEYDEYKITINQDVDDNFWLYVEHHGNWAAVLNTEPIPPAEQAVLPPMPPGSEPKALPKPPVTIDNDELE